MTHNCIKINFRPDHSLVLRTVQTKSLPASASQEILNSQRLLRPSSPHFTIYQPQLTWLGSIANRVTGSALSVCKNHFWSITYRVGRLTGLVHPHSAVWLLSELPHFPCGRHAVRWCPIGRFCAFLARVGQERQQGASRCAVCLPQLEWSKTFTLGFG